MTTDTMLAAAALEGRPIFSADGTNLGDVSAVFLDKETRKPEWLAVRRGLLGGKQVLVPATAATLRGDEIHVPYSDSEIEKAPHAEGEEVSQTTERQLAAHYRLPYSEDRSSTGLPEPGRGVRRQPSRGSRTQPTDGARSRADDELTRDELYAEARRLGIEGRSKMNKAELARAVAKHASASGRSSGTGGTSKAKANPIEVQKFLEAVHYPTRKADLVREAERQGASAEVRATLERIRDEKFDDPTDVSEAIGRLS